MSYYLKSGSIFRVATKESMDLHESFPIGNYVIKFSPESGFYLDSINEFTIPPKLYGDIRKNTDRILNTFEKRPSGTGVLLCGEKGSGKSLLAKNVSIEAAKQGIATLIINQPWHGDGFNHFIQNIDQPCIVLLDEYEKVYDRETQPAMLTLLDGVYPSKKLFMLTVNDKWRVDEHMRNRPGRIFYIMDYSGLSEDFIREFCQDNLQGSILDIEKIVQISRTFDQFNFDMLKALIEEMNRYGESVVDAIRFLNVRAEFASAVDYNVEMIFEGIKIPKEQTNNQSFRGNPLSKEFSVSFIHGVDDEGDKKYHKYDFKPNDIKKIDEDGKLIFAKDGAVAILSKVTYSQYNWITCKP